MGNSDSIGEMQIASDTIKMEESGEESMILTVCGYPGAESMQKVSEPVQMEESRGESIILTACGCPGACSCPTLKVAETDPDVQLLIYPSMSPVTDDLLQDLELPADNGTINCNETSRIQQTNRFPSFTPADRSVSRLTSTKKCSWNKSM